MQHWLHKFIRGFWYAAQGIMVAFHERNMRVHGVALVVVILTGIYFQLEAWEWISIFLISGAVLSAEIVNTALEDICNTMRDTLKVPYTGSKAARDMAAGAVLILAITAVIVAGFIFIPRFLALV